MKHDISLMTIKENLVQAFVFFRIYMQWKNMMRHVPHASYPPQQRTSLVVVPCDPWTVGGSRGDEAMVLGVISYFRKQYPDCPVHIICADKGKDYVQRLSMDGVDAIASWNGAYSLSKVYRSIIAAKPTDVVILGADCMDGFYSPILSLQLLSIHALCCNTPNLRSRLLGFSFNERPSLLMVRAFKSLPSNTCIRIRDRVSMARYVEKVNRSAKLVADAAFMLLPNGENPMIEQVKGWVEDQRLKGRHVIGLNIHPMLRKYVDDEEIRKDAIRISEIVVRILHRNPTVSLVFVPHDERTRVSDNLMLCTIYEQIFGGNPINDGKKTAGVHNRIFYVKDVLRAQHAKALCGLLDGIVCSRMHLAIAALGMAIPVMAATYQGKFEGLFRHFNLDDKFLLSPDKFISDDMIPVFESFCASLPALKASISKVLPSVLKLSILNLHDE